MEEEEQLEEAGSLVMPHPEERLSRWLAIASTMPPEKMAAFIESPQASWAVLTVTGGQHDRVRLTAYLNEAVDLPYWAFALAKSYLDDVGEFPLFGMQTELAFAAWEEHQDTSRAVREILDSVKPVWPDLEVLYVGLEQR